MPKTIVCTAPGQLAWKQYEDPALGPEQVRIQSQFGAAKHGTELATFKGYENARGNFDSEFGVFRVDPEAKVNYPRGIGNIQVGQVVAKGDAVKQFALGDRVMAHAGFAQSLTLPASHFRRLPDGVSWQSAVCFDPAEFALGAVRDGNIRIGDAVAIFGLGAIGLIAAVIAKLAGAYPVLAIDPLANRRAAATALGADLAIDPTQCDAGLAIKEATRKRGADVVIEYSGNRRALQAALRGVAFGGNVVAGAFPAPYDAGLDFGAEAHLNRPNIIFSRACSDPSRDHPRWNDARITETAWELIRSGKIDGTAIISPVVAFEELMDEYPRIASEPQSNIKLGVRY